MQIQLGPKKQSGAFRLLVLILVIHDMAWAKDLEETHHAGLKSERAWTRSGEAERLIVHGWRDAVSTAYST